MNRLDKWGSDNREPGVPVIKLIRKNEFRY